VDLGKGKNYFDFVGRAFAFQFEGCNLTKQIFAQTTTANIFI